MTEDLSAIQSKRITKIWSSMKQRCLNPKAPNYKDYGGRGIRFCDDWRSLDSFKQWAISSGYSSKLTIDRINGDKDYSPSNCRWSDYSTQSANQRKYKSNKSGFIGVQRSRSGKYKASIDWRKVRVSLGVHNSAKEAAIVRDVYVIENELPHTLNFSRNLLIGLFIGVQ